MNDEDKMCPNCVTPWKCNGPHEPPQRQPSAGPVAFPARRAVEREIERTENPSGLHLNDGKERVFLPAGTLRYMLALIDRGAEPQPSAESSESVEWLMRRCEEYQQRAHAAERVCPHIRSSGPADRATNWCSLNGPSAESSELVRAARDALTALELTPGYGFAPKANARNNAAIAALRAVLGAP